MQIQDGEQPSGQLQAGRDVHFADVALSGVQDGSNRSSQKSQDTPLLEKSSQQQLNEDVALSGVQDGSNRSSQKSQDTPLLEKSSQQQLNEDEALSGVQDGSDRSSQKSQDTPLLEKSSQQQLNEDEALSGVQDGSDRSSQKSQDTPLLEKSSQQQLNEGNHSSGGSEAVGNQQFQQNQGESIADGKVATQSSTAIGASRALSEAHRSSGSLTQLEKLTWWKVDLRGYFNINNITLTAATNGWATFMAAVSVEVLDKDISLCPDVQVEWCGNVSSTVASGEEFTFTCNATFPVRFVRVSRNATTSQRLGIGHVDVQGEGTKKPYRSNFKSTKNKVSRPFLTTSAMTAGDCGIICHRHHSCIDFSYSKTAPTGANCLLTDKPLSSYFVNDISWTTNTLECLSTV
ncbi:uncharacterized protein [Haliotis cracherodii]|uniref:uncharacterized protein n=1 Tax=Haliotis cracherodii TaxID=6455 RepID=UPI0039EBB1A1